MGSGPPAQAGQLPYLDPSGKVYEITASPREVRLIGRVSPGRGAQRLEQRGAWTVVSLDGTEQGVTAP